MKSSAKILIVYCCLAPLIAVRAVGAGEATSVDECAIDGLLETTTNSGAGLVQDDASRKPRIPPLSIASEWHGPQDGFQYSSHEVGTMLPLLFLKRSQPPLISLRFNYTDLRTPSNFDLPSDLYDFSIGTFVRKPINDRWSINMLLNGSLSTDGKNTTGDAYRFRGGVFGMYRPNDRWTWQLGFMALGRNDLPVVPAVGVTWQPIPSLVIDLTMPRPRISRLISDDGSRQQWLYVGAGLNGRTWGIQDNAGRNDQLTYGDVRAVVGWESTPIKTPGIGYVPGRTASVECGYVFSRDLELEDLGTAIELPDTWMMRAAVRF